MEERLAQALQGQFQEWVDAEDSKSRGIKRPPRSWTLHHSEDSENWWKPRRTGQTPLGPRAKTT